jgi:hypothetical protein
MFAMRWRSSGRLLRQVSGLEQRLAELNAARVREAQRDESAAADEVLALRRQLSAEAKAHEKAFNELRALAEQWVTRSAPIRAPAMR